MSAWSIPDTLFPVLHRLLDRIEILESSNAERDLIAKEAISTQKGLAVVLARVLDRIEALEAERDENAEKRSAAQRKAQMEMMAALKEHSFNVASIQAAREKD